MARHATGRRPNLDKRQALDRGAMAFRAGRSLHPYDAAKEKRRWGWWRDGWLGSLYTIGGLREPPADGEVPARWRNTHEKL
jgi:hypothetical protein